MKALWNPIAKNSHGAIFRRVRRELENREPLALFVKSIFGNKLRFWSSFVIPVFFEVTIAVDVLEVNIKVPRYWNIHIYRLQNSRVFCEREKRSLFERKVWNECKTPFTREDRANGAPQLPKTSENDCFAVYHVYRLEIT